MSGWIKVEKDLATDPRVLRMASRLRHADVTLGSRSRLVIVGALVTLWWYADTHICEDDTLPVGVDQINELVGVDGFCDLMPTEWLQVLNADSVKLVDYSAHNGTTAKKRAMGQKRQERCRNANADVTPASRSRNADSVTREEKIRVEKKEELDLEPRVPRATAKRLPDDFQLTESRACIARAEAVNPEREYARFCDHWRAASGASSRKHDWDAAWRNWCRRASEFKRPVTGAAAQTPERTWKPTEEDDRAIR